MFRPVVSVHNATPIKDCRPSAIISAMGMVSFEL